MSVNEIHHLLAEPIACHAWNKDRTQVAISPNNNDIVIYKKEGGAFVKSDTLQNHDARVTSIDWAASSNRIVSCGADRNAYVWTNDGKEWKPTLVILRINRAATFVRWSPKEDKFAVASGARLISVCYFDPEHDWWVSKHIKKPIRSTVLSLDWHPNNILLAAGSADFKARIFFAGIKGVDEKPTPTAWGGKNALGDCVREFGHGSGGWVHSIAFSPSGNRLAWVGHNSSISVVEAGETTEPLTTLFASLPYSSLLWATENSIVTGGFECFPALWSVGGGGAPKFVAKLDQAVKKVAVEGNAMSKFKNLDTRATTTENQAQETALDTVHQNPITQVSAVSGAKEKVAKFATSGSDGRLIVWDVKALESSISDAKFA